MGVTGLTVQRVGGMWTALRSGGDVEAGVVEIAFALSLELPGFAAVGALVGAGREVAVDGGGGEEVEIVFFSASGAFDEAHGCGDFHVGGWCRVIGDQWEENRRDA